jgi:hypothetical protein
MMTMIRATLLSGLLLSLSTVACSDDGADTELDAAQRDLPEIDGSKDAPGQEAQPAPDAGQKVDTNGDAETPVDLPQRDGDGPPLAQNCICHNAKVVNLTGGKASVKGDTSLSIDEFGAQVTCGKNDLDGPQLYYEVTIPADQGLRMILSAQFNASLVVFSDTTGCKPAAVDLGCASPNGGRFDVLKGQTRAFHFWPSGGTYIIAVDSTSASSHGNFVLTLELLAKASNITCATPEPVSLASGPVTIKDSSALSVNEFSFMISCGKAYDFVGPQLYYKVSLGTGKILKATLDASFIADVYIFSAAGGCKWSAIEASCASKGKSGAVYSFQMPGVQSWRYFEPATAGDYILAVDSASPHVGGPFTLTLEELDPAANSACAKAQLVTVAAGKVTTIRGDTTKATNEFSGLKCGGSTALAGPQRYYKVNLSANTTYRINLSPEFTSFSGTGYLYVFSDAAKCTEAGIEADCAGGKSGDKLAVASSKTGDLFFTPPVGGPYYIGIDSASAAAEGPFTLQINEHVSPHFTAPFSFDFEGDCEGLSPTLDWECGALDYSVKPSCLSSCAPPAAAHSGKGMWGTRLNSCYTDLGNASTTCSNKDPTDDSVLKFKVTLPSSWKTTAMTYWSWEDIYGSYDWAELRIDGKVVPGSQLCPSGYAKPTAWIKRTVDLSAYLGKTIEVAFHFMATVGTSTSSAGTSCSGWYIDDLAVTGK